MIASLVLAAAQTMTFTADRVAADNVTHALAASGHVVAASGPVTLRGEHMVRDVDGTMLFYDPTCVTTCTNELGHTHWNISGEVAYKADDYVILRNMVLRFYEIPIFWLPYLYYPMGTETGFQFMAGYTGRWGAYLLTRYGYHLLGDPNRDESTWWLDAATRFDLRWVQGLAVGEDIKWNLGDFGSGGFDIYYARDLSVDDRSRNDWHMYEWGSEIEPNRYSMSLHHRWEATERDTVRLRGSYFSDSYFREDFNRAAFLGWRNNIYSYENSGVFWEHLENNFAVGVEASGRLNDFYEMTGRLPELYFDLNPMPLFGLPVNYETENRIGWLRRDPAYYGNLGSLNPLSCNPGPWAEYDAVRFDTYHRFTAPFKLFDDILSVVPRVGYRGTFWSESGSADLTGAKSATEEGALFRSIVEGGMTFAARGEGWVNDIWRHMVEPYFDVLAQKAWFAGSGDRPYVFDNLDASVMWEDQFAGRSRNLPYSYYGVTPGIRNAWEVLSDQGNLSQVIDFDVYAAFQFGETSYLGTSDQHKLAEVGYPNYGKNPCYVMPGMRLRWMPSKDFSLMTRAEYDSDNNTVASADAGLQHKLSDWFKYDVSYALRDFRCWDYSSSDAAYKSYEDVNDARLHFIHIGFEHQVFDWFAWGPFVSWDIKECEWDRVGSWFDYLTDCLGFRLQIEYQNSYTRVDGYEREADWSVGFYVYLRAFGAESASNFFR